MSILTLTEHQTPEAQCAAGEFFVQPDHRGWWVYSWDGREAWTMGDEPYATREEAEAAAYEALAMATIDPDLDRNGPDDPEPLEFQDDVERELIEAWRAVPAHRAAWCRGILLAVLREMGTRGPS